MISNVVTLEYEIPYRFGSFRALLKAPGQIELEESMRSRTSLVLATLFVVCFTIAAWSAPFPALPGADHLSPTSDNQSLSGTVAAIGDAEFSLQVTKNHEVNTVQFLVDDKTKVEGKLAVGAQATVEYRSNEGKNIAVRVIVTPASGMNSY